jgi:hypothetical protein
MTEFVLEREISLVEFFNTAPSVVIIEVYSSNTGAAWIRRRISLRSADYLQSDSKCNSSDYDHNHGNLCSCRTQKFFTRKLQRVIRRRRATGKLLIFLVECLSDLVHLLSQTQLSARGDGTEKQVTVPVESVVGIHR